MILLPGPLVPGFLIAMKEVTAIDAALDSGYY
jgi:hypothetical protein